MMQTGPSIDRPLLTLAIPTYNRSVYLNQLLSILLEELAGETRIEVIISDNASTDDTPLLVEDYRQKGLTFRYLRNGTNIGPDANFLQCFEHAHGKYIWLFGDDDIIVPGGIRTILRLLTKNEYGLVYLSPYSFRRDCVKERTSDRFGRFAERLTDGSQLVQRVGTMITFMSAVIINRDYYAALSRQISSDLTGTNLIQLGWICPILAHSSSFLIVWEKLVGGRRDNCRGWGACQVFGVNLKRITHTTMADREDIATLLCNKTLIGWFPGTIMDIRRGTGSPLDSENIREVLEPTFSHNWRYWTHVYPLITLPVGLAAAWNSLIQFANRLEWLFFTILNLAAYRESLSMEGK